MSSLKECRTAGSPLIPPRMSEWEILPRLYAWALGVGGWGLGTLGSHHLQGISVCTPLGMIWLKHNIRVAAGAETLYSPAASMLGSHTATLRPGAAGTHIPTKPATL